MIMLIRLFSDIHLEFGRNYKIPSASNFFVSEMETDKDTVLCLAGDICSIKSNNYHISFFESLRDRFKEVLYIPGNHEYYNGSLDTIDDKLQKMCDDYGITFLQNKSIDIDNITFIGATLWTNLKKCDPLEQFNISNTMNDYRKIRFGNASNAYQHRFNILRHQQLHDLHLSFIKSQLQNNINKPVVVMTHHTPSIKSIHEQYRKYSKSNRAYYSDLDDMIEEFQPLMWLHGHTHCGMDYKLFNTRVLCNPIGYPDEPSEWQDYLIEI